MSHIHEKIDFTNDILSRPQNKHEQTDTKWVTREELRNMDLKPNIFFYATKALEELAEK